jgi:hypothetical protein
MDFELSVLKECIAAGSNAPYWEKGGWFIDHDLRNPKLYKEREEICEQFGIPASQLMK